MKTNSKSSKLIINEVDCYIGNAWNYYEYASDKAVQHQIILIEDGEEFPVGRRNGVTDSDRGERIVFETSISAKMAYLWKEACNIRNNFKNEICNTVEEFNRASEYNKPLRKQIEEILMKIYLEIPIKMPVNHFIKLALY